MHSDKTLYHFVIQTDGDVYHVFVTIMSHVAATTTIDLWCPENQLLNKRFTATKVDGIGDYLHGFVRSMMVENHIVGVLKYVE